jgi:uncharacterized protein (TIGR02594 family)
MPTLLKFGMSDNEVKKAQLALAARHYPLLGTGYYGPATREVVKSFQIIHGLKVTGIIDDLTATTLFKPVSIKSVEKSSANLTAPPWLATAISSIGIAEVPGNKDNPVILAMAKKCGGQIAKTYVHDEIAWCKMFVEYCLASNGLHGNDTLWALDSAKIGTKLAGPAFGAIACKRRTGGGHTFIIAGKDKNGLLVAVGGNQGDRVSRATFKTSEIVSYNWPNGYPLPVKTGLSSLPVVDSAPLSKREA